MKDSPEKKTLNFSKKYVFEYSLTFMKTLIDLSTNIDSYSVTNVYKTVKNHIIIPSCKNVMLKKSLLKICSTNVIWDTEWHINKIAVAITYYDIFTINVFW